MTKTFGPGARVLLVGATSGIARELAREFARRGFHLVLAARDEDELELVARDCRVRGGSRIEVETRAFSALAYASHAKFWRSCGEVSGVVVCHGLLEGEVEARSNWSQCKQLLEINYNSVVSLLNLVADDFEERESGFIAVLSSVAGDRARKGNYIYGSAKAGVSAYAEGLRMRLYRSGVTVTTIKPGPVDTGMTWGMGKLPLLASPEKVASDIYRGLRRKADVIYTPAPWRLIMGAMKIVPGFLWKKLDF